MVQIGSRTSQHFTGYPQRKRQSQMGRRKQRHPAVTPSDHPKMQLWDWDANATAGFDPRKIICSSHDQMACSKMKVSWKCSYGHEWMASLNHRTSQHPTGFPLCSKQLQMGSSNQRHPALTQTDHPMMFFWNWDANDTARSNPSKISRRSDKSWTKGLLVHFAQRAAPWPGQGVGLFKK